MHGINTVFTLGNLFEMKKNVLFVCAVVYIRKHFLTKIISSLSYITRVVRTKFDIYVFIDLFFSWWYHTLQVTFDLVVSRNVILDSKNSMMAI